MRLKIHLFCENQWIACISIFLDVVSFLFFYKKSKYNQITFFYWKWRKDVMENKILQEKREKRKKGKKKGWSGTSTNIISVFFSFLIKIIERLSIKRFWWEYNLFRKLVQKQITKIPSRLSNLSQKEHKTGILTNYYSYFVSSNLLSAILPQIEYFDKILEKSNCHFPTN